MKYILSTLFIIVSSAAAISHAGQDGNGGFGVKCEKASLLANGKTLPAGIHTLDYVDAQHVFKLEWDLGPTNMPWQQKLELMAERLQPLNISVAETLRNVAKNPNKYFHITEDTVVCENQVVIGRDIDHNIDIGFSKIPPSCKLVQIANNVQRCDTNLHFNSQQTNLWNIFINKNFLDQMSNDSIAAIFAHEIFYSAYKGTFYSGAPTTSEKARKLVTFLATNFYSSLSPEERKKEFLKIGIYGLEVEVADVRFSTYQYFNIEEGTHPEDIKAIYRDDGTLKQIIATNMRSAPYPSSFAGQKGQIYLITEPLKNTNHNVYSFSETGKPLQFYLRKENQFSFAGLQIVSGLTGDFIYKITQDEKDVIKSLSINHITSKGSLKSDITTAKYNIETTCSNIALVPYKNEYRPQRIEACNRSVYTDKSSGLKITYRIVDLDTEGNLVRVVTNEKDLKAKNFLSFPTYENNNNIVFESLRTQGNAYYLSGVIAEDRSDSFFSRKSPYSKHLWLNEKNAPTALLISATDGKIVCSEYNLKNTVGIKTLNTGRANIFRYGWLTVKWNEQGQALSATKGQSCSSQ